MKTLGLRTYIAEPGRGPRKWANKGEQKAAVYGNRRRIQGPRGKALLRKRGEMLERPFAHLFETGGMRRLYVRGKGNVQKKLLLQAAACNLGLLLRQMLGAGTPRALRDRLADLFLLFFWMMALAKAAAGAPAAVIRCCQDNGISASALCCSEGLLLKNTRFRHGLLGWPGRAKARRPS